MASIDIGTFRGYGNSSNYGRYQCYLEYDSIYRSGNNICISNARVRMARYSSGYTTNRIACKAGYNGSTNNIHNNKTLNSSGTASPAEISFSLGNLSVASNGNSIAIYIEIASTGASGSWNNFQSTNLVWNSSVSGGSSVSPSAPGAPSAVTIPSSIAPDKTASISWRAASGGSNGVNGYEWQYSNNGGSSWNNGGTLTGTSTSLNLNTHSFVNGSRLKVRVRAYTTVNGTKYYSGWAESGVTTTSFVAPGSPTGLSLTYNQREPIPNCIYTGNWNAPTSGGSNGISGYEIQWLKNGANFGSSIDTSSRSNAKTTTESSITPGDKISFKVRAYTIGQRTKYYSGWTTSSSITILSDKFIYTSTNGGTLDKHKAYVSVNGKDFVEIKKEKLSIIK